MGTGRLLALSLAFVALHAGPSGAQILSGAPITIVVPFAPGASADSLMRLVTKAVSDKTGQVFIIDNRSGGGGALAAMSVKRAAPDGNTLLQANAGSHAILQELQPELKYDPVGDFQPITVLWTFPHYLVVPANSFVRSVHDLVASAKRSPRGFSFGSPGVGTGGHILGEMLRSAGAPLTHVPFRGAAPALVDLVAGRVDFMFASYASVKSFLDSKSLRALALAGHERLPVQPTIPTMREAGYPGVNLEFWFGLVAPAGTPARAIDALHAAFTDALTDQALVSQMQDLGVQPIGGAPGAFASLISSDVRRFADLLRAKGIAR